ncbi:hypothetical protein ACJJTC_015867 [Scirpophaga incertulas]
MEGEDDTPISSTQEDDNSGFISIRRRRGGKKKIVKLGVSKNFVLENVTDKDICSNNDESGVNFVDHDLEPNIHDSIALDGQLKALPEINDSASLIGRLKEQNHEELENNENKVEELVVTVEEETVIYNSSRSLPLHATTYELEKFEKKLLLIFNQKNIIGKKERLGTAKDVEELEKTFKPLGFDVEVENDLTKSEIIARLLKFSEKDYTDYGCVAVTVLTHGSDDGLLYAKDIQYNEQDIIKFFKVDMTPSLLTKPKLLIVQACRGTDNIKGVMVRQSSGKIQKDNADEADHYTLPVESDMLFLHSSYMGKPSHRDETHGSWFIQALCRNINKYASKLDFESIMTEVKREVAIDYYHKEFNRRTYEYDINKQIPVTTSTLIRKLFLRKFGEQPSEPPTPEVSVCVPRENHSVYDSSYSFSSTPYQLCTSCFIERFDYMINSLSLYIEDNPTNVFARSLLLAAETVKRKAESKSVIKEMLVAISLYLSELNDHEHRHFNKSLKYVHFYKE